MSTFLIVCELDGNTFSSAKARADRIFLIVVSPYVILLTEQNNAVSAVPQYNCYANIYIILILCYFLQDYFGKELKFIKSIPYRRYAIGYGIYYLILL